MDRDTENTFDVIVIGAGPAGEVAAERCHRGGLSVAIVERRLVGGECSFFACIPSKALLRPVHAAAAANRVRGVSGPVRLDSTEVLARRDYWNNALDDTGAAGWVSDAGMTLVRGDARLSGPRRVTVGDRELTARRAVILATGSGAAVPDIPGLREAQPWTNIEATTASSAPKSLVVLGGGVVACEMAQVYAALGTSVTLVVRGDRLLGKVEEFAARLVEDGLRADGIDLRLTAQVTSVARQADGSVLVETVPAADADADPHGGDATIAAEQVLCALGRTPHTGTLGMESVGGQLDKHGYVEVGDDLAVRFKDADTSAQAPWLYAVGDVNGKALLTHMGKYQARACGDLIAARAQGSESVDQSPLSAMRSGATAYGSPQVIFTDPQVSAVGLTAAEASARGLRTRVVDVPLENTAGAGLQADGYRGQARLVVDEDRQVIVGATFAGQDVAELVHAATIAVIGEVPLARLWHAVPSFPTMSEVWLRLLEEYGL